MTVLTKLWEVTSFRDLLLDLAGETDEQVRSLVRYVSAARTATDVVDDGAVANDEQRKYLPLIETLLRIRDSDGVVPLVDDLEQIEDERVQRVSKVLGPAINEEPLERDRRLIARAQRATLPVADDIDVTVDFRLMEAEKSSGDFRLVPVVKVRLFLDEPIGGSRNLVFQLEDATLLQLESSVKHALSLRSAALSRISRDLLPEGLDPLSGEPDGTD